jgi:phosphopantothenoylcysteine decarboxylase/phosphopantothenate--cysteine ligase
VKRGPLRILITAGPTREYIDRVRYLSNESSGKMGFALAAAAAERGHRATLIHGPVAIEPAPGVRAIAITSAADLLTACRDEWPSHDALIMAAAVADYTPKHRFTTKLKKSAAAMTVKLEPTIDVLADLAKSRRADQIVVGFALEDHSPRRNAESKLRRKKLDAIVLNKPAAMSADHSTVEILVRGCPWESVGKCAKNRLAQRIVRLVEQFRRADRT